MSFDISSRSERLTQRLFVEASAGTGKTFVIEHYIVRSILTTSFNPEKLALITFTKAVARELRLRLRATLKTTLASVLEGGFSPTSTPSPENCHSKEGHNDIRGVPEKRPVPDYLLPILEQDEICRGRAARTIEEAIERLGQAMITTIHGFCDRLLCQWEEATGAGGVEEWIGEEEKKQWLQEFLQEGAGFRGGELEVVSKKYWHDQEMLITHLVKLMDDVDGTEDKAWDAAQEAVAQIKKKVGEASAKLAIAICEVPAKGRASISTKPIVVTMGEERSELCPRRHEQSAVASFAEASEGEKIANALAAKAKNYRGTTKKDGTLKSDIAKAFTAIQNLVETGVTEKTIDPLYQFSLLKCFATPLAKKTELSIEDEALATLVLEELWPALQQLVDGECIVQRLAQRSAKAFMEFVTKSGKKTPQIVIRRVFELAADEKFLAFASEAVEWLIVDEFQDTDAMQYEIFSRLFLNNPLWNGRVLFVGDPKQAIYGFRKADVYSYLAAKKALLPHEIRTLAVNYRAERHVVEAQNRLFAGLKSSWVFYLPLAGTSLQVVPCDVGKEPEKSIGDGRGALHLPVARHSLGRKRRWPHDELEQQGVFPWLADEMIALQSRGIAFKRQAVLVKDRHQAKRVQQFLEERSIPTCAWRVDTVTESPIYQWLQKAFCLAIRPHEARRLSALLLDMPTDYHLELCRAMAADRRTDQWAACAVAWTGVSEAFYEGGVAAMARACFTCRWNGRDTVEEWLHTMPKGDDLLIDLEHLFELLSLLEPILPHSLEAYGDALKNITSHFSEEMETLIRRVDPDDEGAPILTMHRSKGLEFDVVFALGCASRTPHQDDIAIDEADAEKLRQLYVAVTRAKRRCYLPILIDEDDKAVPLGQASPVELLCAALSAEGEPSSAWTSTLYQSMSGAARLNTASSLCQGLSHAITMSDVGAEQRMLVYPNKLKNREFANAKSPRFDSEKTSSTSDVGAVFPESKVGLLAKAKTDSSTCLGICAKKQKSASIRTPLPKPSWSSRSYRSFSSGNGHGNGIGHGDGAKESVPHFGIRFHEQIARLLFAPPEARASVEAVAGWLKGQGAYDAQMAQLLYDAVRVKLPLGDETVCLEDVPRGDMRAECGFLDREDGERYVQGVLDLVLVWKGAVYAIDWKTHEVEGGRCREVVEQGYEQQHSIYLQAVVRAFASQFRYGGFFFIFVRHLGCGGIVGYCGGGK